MVAAWTNGFRDLDMDFHEVLYILVRAAYDADANALYDVEPLSGQTYHALVGKITHKIK
jgi:hypothetical protein